MLNVICQAWFQVPLGQNPSYQVRDICSLQTSKAEKTITPETRDEITNP